MVAKKKKRMYKEMEARKGSKERYLEEKMKMRELQEENRRLKERKRKKN